MKRLITLTVFALATLSLSATTFKIVYLQGKCQYKKAGKAWTVLNSKDIVLDDKDSVDIGEKAELILKDPSDKMISLKTKGAYSLVAAYRSASASKSMSSELLSYIFHEVSSHKEQPEDAATKQIANIGGVSRGKSEPFLVSPLPNSLFTSSDVTFSWTGQKEGLVTFGLFRDLATKKEVFTKRLGDSTIAISSKELSLDTERVYYWKVISLQHQNTDVWPFKVISANDAAVIKADLQKLQSELNYSEGLNQLITAKFFERKQLLYDAELSYKGALKAEPDNKQLQDLYKEFRATYQPK